MFRIFTGIVLLAAACAANAQSKDQLIQRLLQLWPVDNIGIALLRGPVDQALGKAEVVLQGRVPPERREAAMKEIAAETQKFYDENIPIIRETSKKLAQSTVAPILAEKFNETELKQIITMLESPVKAKFESVTPEIQKAVAKKVAADLGGTITPKMEDLQKKIGERLRVAATP